MPHDPWCYSYLLLSKALAPMPLFLARCVSRRSGIFLSRTLLDFRCANTRAAELVDSLPRYKAIIAHARNAFTVFSALALKPSAIRQDVILRNSYV